MYRQAYAIAYEHQINFGSPAVWAGTTIPVSQYGIGLSLFYVPGMLLAPLLGLHGSAANVHNDYGFAFDSRLYALVVTPVQVGATAAAAYLVARLVRVLGFGTPTALWGELLFGVASPAIVYSHGDSSMPVAALCLAGGVYGAWLFRSTGSVPALLGAGLAVLYGILTRPADGALAGAAALALIVPGLRPRAWPARCWAGMAVVVASGGAAVGLTLLLNWVRFGSPLITGYEHGGWTTPVWVGVPPALFSPAHGIVWEFPAIVLAPVALWQLRRSRSRQLAVVMGAACLLEFLSASTWWVWWGGNSWGLRFFEPALPLAAALAATARLLSRISRPAWALLFAGGLAWAVPWLLVDVVTSGYGALNDAGAGRFEWRLYAPIGAWAYLPSVWDADPVWIRLAARRGSLYLVPPLLLIASAMALTAWAWRLAQRPGTDAPAS
jgi:hypothetical protein